MGTLLYYYYPFLSIWVYFTVIIKGENILMWGCRRHVLSGLFIDFLVNYLNSVISNYGIWWGHRVSRSCRSLGLEENNFFKFTNLSPSFLFIFIFSFFHPITHSRMFQNKLTKNTFFMILNKNGVELDWKNMRILICFT